MHKMFKVTAAIIAALYVCPAGFAFTQADCDQLKKLQTDGSGREINAKLDANAQGNCLPKPPGEQPKLPLQRQPQPPPAGR